MFGTAGVIIVADIRASKMPTARQLVGLGVVFAALAGLADVAPGVAMPLAALVFTGVLLAKGLPALKGLSIASADTSKLVGTAQPGPVSGQSGVTTLGGIAGGQIGENADSTPSPKATRALRFARAAIGTPYVWGGESSSGYDCSGLTQAAYLAAGVRIPRTAQEQHDAGFASVAWGRFAPGDLIFSNFEDASPDVGHVVMYAGGGKCVAAPHTGATVEIEPLTTFAGQVYRGASRPAPMQVSRISPPSRRKVPA